MSLARALFCSSCLVAVIAGVPRPAQAQWYFQGYLGGNHTQSADVHIAQPSAGVDLTYTAVTFDARPFEAPQYYGYRFGHAQRNGRLAFEFEFLHEKIYAVTDVAVQTIGHVGGVTISGAERMDARVQRYSMSHGLNFLLANLVSRQPIGSGESSFVLRGGLGPTLPHGESEVFGVTQEQYEWAGLGLQASAGVDLHLTGRLSGIIEYKLTYAHPTITIPNGTGDMVAVTHHLAIGLGVRLSSR
jgi:opacity protein-like surface antigen